jgi:hypothetical protein
VFPTSKDIDLISLFQLGQPIAEIALLGDKKSTANAIVTIR